MVDNNHCARAGPRDNFFSRRIILKRIGNHIKRISIVLSELRAGIMDNKFVSSEIIAVNKNHMNNGDRRFKSRIPELLAVYRNNDEIPLEKFGDNVTRRDSVLYPKAVIPEIFFHESRGVSG